MARQKKFKKMKMPKALESARDFLLKKAAVIIVIAVFLSAALAMTKAFFERSDYFRLKSVDMIGSSDASFASVRNVLLKSYRDINIFKIDLKSIADELEPKYQDAKSIIVKRVLPDKLLIDLKFRKPFAMLTNGQLYPVDREGVVLVNRDTSRLKDLPIIKGVDPRSLGRTHNRSRSRTLEAALDLIAEIKKARFLDRYGVRIIDAGDIKSLSFYLGENGPLVIIGYENFKERLNALRDTLRDPRIALDRINYIDVRFKDVAISPR